MVPGVGASKVVRCPFCKEQQDRDGGAARNIFLKVLFAALLQDPCKLLRVARRIALCMLYATPLLSDFIFCERQSHPTTSTNSIPGNYNTSAA